MQEQQEIVTKLRDYILGPTRFMNVLSCFELGIIRSLKEAATGALTAEQIAAEVKITENAVQQLLQLLVKDDLVAYDTPSASYRLKDIALVTDDVLAQALAWFKVIKHVLLRQLYYLPDCVRTGKLVGLKELYDFDGNFYEASALYPELLANWSPVMDQITAAVDPWFYANLEVPHNARILDIGGHTGLGAVLAYQHYREKEVQVTCFDFPGKKSAAVENFRTQGVEGHCTFVGGDVLERVPGGFDVVMLKHFLVIFEKEEVYRILKSVHAALNDGGQVFILTPVYEENLKASAVPDFFPALLLGCTIAKGGPQKASTYERWLDDCGFEVTKVLPQDVSSDPLAAICADALICAKKVPQRPRSS
ncbi:methyltransferase [Streptomyces spectabilis]|uniref:Putative transcriptional regulator n=1 Tax=Streptomyces spectabilis TaxID=68270 RepID=A0A7W8B4U5_STRST|nr:methyltransferase [Streptomyces spectabilis]MBB5109731.1 putative transcriptional regulator [Streptomyces spectabilis]GGV55299.1 hypothetical protein GCM10010245_87540 [Streptomyces spectabilis]